MAILDKVLDSSIGFLVKIILGTFAVLLIFWIIGIQETFVNSLVEMQLCDEKTAKVLLVILCGIPNSIIFRHKT